MKMIVGLGNPGEKYKRTRHNAGFMVVDELSYRHRLVWQESKGNSLVAKGTIHQEKALLMKPLTFMNESGYSVSSIMNYYKLALSSVIIVYDDLDLPVGKIRLRARGSAGGHNGIKSIINHLHTDQFQRLRVGIDRPEREGVSNYVLSDFAKREQADIIGAIRKSADAVEAFLNDSFIGAMNKFN